ncbi:MAG: carboxypeptidase-like regulatory domain-containing protein [Candidatus Thermoplasmatota archaeon]
MRLVLAVALVALLAGCAGNATPQAPLETGRIDGAVVDQILRPFSFLNVTLVNLDRVDVTSEMGGFTFRNLPAGSYTLVAQAEGTLGDVKVVEVKTGQVTRVILQLLPVPSVVPFVTSLHNRAQEDLGMPGATCDSCAWGTFLLNHPDDVVLRASWSALPVGSSTVTITLRDDEDQELGSVTGASPLELAISGADIDLDATRLKVSFRYADDFTPQSFDVESFLDLYYNGSRN